MNAEARTRRGRVALRDIARLAGVDVSTVSRALNRDPRISGERSAQILRLSRRLGYRPMPMRAKRTGAVGLLIGSENPLAISGAGEHFLERAAWLAQRELNALGLHANIECFDRASTAPPGVVAGNRVDGALVMGNPHPGMVAGMLAHGVPLVAINDSSARLGVPCVSCDSRGAVCEIVTRLAAHGRRSFALLLNDSVCFTSRMRLDGYGDGLAGAGIGADPAWVVTDLPPEIRGGRDGVRELARRGVAPDVLLCCNDWVALGALMELRASGLAVPGAVDLFGHDDVPFCADLSPTLSSIARSEAEIVSKAVAALIKQIEKRGSVPMDSFVRATPVWRGSAALAPA